MNCLVRIRGSDESPEQEGWIGHWWRVVPEPAPVSEPSPLPGALSIQRESAFDESALGKTVKQLLSPRQFAGAIGVSQSSVKRWTDDGLIHATRTAGGHRRIHITEAIRFLRESDSVLVKPHVLGLPVEAATDRSKADLDSAAAELEELLRQGASSEARGLIQSLYIDGYSVADIVDGPVHRSMANLGHLWLPHGDEGIFLEHRATQIALQAFHELRTLLPDHPNGPLAIGGAPSGDPYQLATLVVSTVLASEGYRVVNLGPETPISLLRRSAVVKAPKLLWLSVSHAEEPAALSRDLNALFDELEPLGIAMAIGGQAAHELEIRRYSRLCIGRSMGELLGFAKGLAAASTVRQGASAAR